MQFTNLNILSFLVFIIIWGIIAFLTYKKYFFQENFNKKYKLLWSDKTFYFKYIFLILSLAIILFWIFWIKYWVNKNAWKVSWIDMMFVLDVSKSMNVADVTDWHYNYTRLDIAKKAIWDYVVKHPNNRYWLVIFAWDAISTIPLTNDHDLFLTMLSGVDYRNLTVQGSDFKKALDLAISRFVWDKDRSKALVFISDWWDEGDNLNIWNIENKDISFAVVWVWTKKWWKIMKGTDVFWRPIYQKYKWQYVISKLNTDNLKTIANKLDAYYFNLEEVYDLRKLDKVFSDLEKKSIELKNSDSLNDISRFLAFISFMFLVLFLGFYIFEEKINLWKK